MYTCKPTASYGSTAAFVVCSSDTKTPCTKVMVISGKDSQNIGNRQFTASTHQQEMVIKAILYIATSLSGRGS